MVVGAEGENKQVGAATNNLIKSLTGGKILSVTDMHGRGLILKVKWNHFK